MYEVFSALLETDPVPSGGHKGYHEAIIPELLAQAHGLIEGELMEPSDGYDSRKAAWTSFNLFCMDKYNPENSSYLVAELGLEDPNAYLSEKLTSEIWEDQILGVDGLWNEFLWDDWRNAAIMDCSEPTAQSLGELMSLDIDVVHPSRIPKRLNLSETCDPPIRSIDL